AIIFSDILIPCTAMGQQLDFAKDHGPILSNPVRSSKDLNKLKIPDVKKDLGFVGDAINITRKSLSEAHAMIGFAGAPFTVASYMVEGGGTKTYAEIKKLLYNEPDTFYHLLDLITETTSEYLLMQIDSGADCLMLFDTWANQISADEYAEKVLPHIRRLLSLVKSKCKSPIIYYPGGWTEIYQDIRDLEIDVIAVDWRFNLSRTIKALNSLSMKVSVQGNLDPQILMGPEKLIREKVGRILREARESYGHIFNVGHGLTPATPIDSIKTVIDEIRKTEKQFL
ncbi:MAG: uroporphyrinogen decarboxylase, partial [Oligoflexales bacterium]|nr:uroporphyrinogen decarboxylase [Oligoflexales bacterium]